jgi:hypothetical protein
MNSAGSFDSLASYSSFIIEIADFPSAFAAVAIFTCSSCFCSSN